MGLRWSSEMIEADVRRTYLLTSEGSLRSFHSPRLNTPPSMGKSDLSTPLRVHSVPGWRESRRT